MTFPFPFFAAGGSNFTLSYVTEVQSSANSNSYSYIATPIGTAAANRYVFVVTAANGNSTDPATGCTIGGVSATEVIAAASTSDGNQQPDTRIYYLKVTSGATATIVINYSGSGRARNQTTVYAVYGDINTVSGYTAKDNTGGATSLSFLTSGDAGEVVISGFAVGGNRTTTWTGLTENFDGTIESGGQAFSSASKVASTGNAETITATASGTGLLALSAVRVS